MCNEHQIDLETIVGEAFYEDLEYLPEYIIKDLIGRQPITNLTGKLLNFCKMIPI